MKRTALKRKAPLRAGPVKKKSRRLVAVAPRRKADTEWSNTIRSRAGWKCERCGATSPYFGPNAGARLHAAHVFSKGGFPHLRYDLDNGLSLCYRHHRWWAHIDPVDFTEWVRKHLGEAKFEALKARAHQKKDVDTSCGAVVTSKP